VLNAGPAGAVFCYGPAGRAGQRYGEGSAPRRLRPSRAFCFLPWRSGYPPRRRRRPARASPSSSVAWTHRPDTRPAGASGAACWRWCATGTGVPSPPSRWWGFPCRSRERWSCGWAEPVPARPRRPRRHLTRRPRPLHRHPRPRHPPGHPPRPRRRARRPCPARPPLPRQVLRPQRRQARPRRRPRRRGPACRRARPSRPLPHTPRAPRRRRPVPPRAPRPLPRPGRPPPSPSTPRRRARRRSRPPPTATRPAGGCCRCSA
jgi:hypothetical protein